MNRHKAKCKEKDKRSGKNKHNIPSADNDTTASTTIKYT